MIICSFECDCKFTNLIWYAETQRHRDYLIFCFFNNFSVSLRLCVLIMLSKDDTEGFFNLTDRVEGDVVFLGVEPLEIILRDDHIREA